jgi:DNA-binding GntR family transcriptional regulator
VHRDTVRAALNILRNEGLVEARRPLGTFVRGEPRTQLVTLPPGAFVRARMPTAQERRRLDLTEGTPLLEVQVDGRVTPYAGNWYVGVVRGGG